MRYLPLSDADRNTLVDVGRQSMQQYLANPPTPQQAVGRGQAAQNADRIANEIATRILEP